MTSRTIAQKSIFLPPDIYKITQKDYYYNCYDKVSLYNNVSEINDIFFVGVDKGRLHKLIKVKKMLYNYKCVYHIVPQKQAQTFLFLHTTELTDFL